MDQDTLLAALQHAHAAGDTATAQKIAAQLATMPGFEAANPGDTGLRGSIDPTAQAAASQPMPPAPAPGAPTKGGYSLMAPTSKSAPAQTGGKGGYSLVAPPPAQVAATNQPQDNGNGTGADPSMDSTNAFLQPFARDMTFGLAPKAEAALATALYAPGHPTLDAIANIPAALMGQGNGAGERYQQYYDAASQAVDARDNALANQHPYLNAAGHTLGFVEGVNALPSLGPAAVAGQPIANVGRAMIAGGVNGGITGAVDTLGKGQDYGTMAGNTAIGAGIGAVAAPIIGGVVSKVAGAVMPQLSKGWQYLAKKFDISPDDLAQHLADNTANGVPNTIAGVVNARNAGVISSLADKNPDLAAGLQAGRVAAQQASPTDMAAAIEQNIPTARPTYLQGVPEAQLSPNSLLNARNAAMDAAVQPHYQTPVTIDPDILSDPNLMDALAGRRFRDLRAQVQDNIPNAQGAVTPGATPLTLQNVEDMRKALGNISERSGDAYAQLRNDLVTNAGAQVPEYSQALQDYGNASKYMQGFGHGNAGNPTTTAGLGNEDVAAALSTPEGLQGHAAGIYINARDQAAAGADSAVNIAKQLSRNTSGNTTFTQANPAGAPAVNATAAAVAARAQSVNQSTPSSVKVPEEQGFGELGGAALKGAAGMTHGALASTYRAVSSLFGGKTFSPVVQRQIATGLTSQDPTIQGQAIEQLRRAGVVNSQIMQLMQTAGGRAGAQASDFLNAGTGQ